MLQVPTSLPKFMLKFTDVWVGSRFNFKNQVKYKIIIKIEKQWAVEEKSTVSISEAPLKIIISSEAAPLKPVPFSQDIPCLSQRRFFVFNAHNEYRIHKSYVTYVHIAAFFFSCINSINANCSERGFLSIQWRTRATHRSWVADQISYSACITNPINMK